MHKTKAAIAGIIALLAAASAAAQTFPSVPANSVIGRLGVGTGPSQAIPFDTLRTQMGIASQPEIYATSYGVRCDGTTDDTAAAQLAITTAAGRPVVFPAGTCKISSTLTYTTSGSTIFTQGLQIRGQGREKTIFDSRVANGYLFSIDSQQDGRFHSGTILQDFKITTLAGSPPAASSGILIHRAANTLIQNVQISSLSGSGIVGTASAGDPDASFIVVLDRVRMDVVAGWCINLAAPSGGYFGSNVRIVNSSLNTCGTIGVATPPTSGGLQIKNLIAQVVNSAFTLNNNVDLYVQGADTSMQFTIDGVDFENNVSTVLPHVYVDGGLRGFHMVNSECLNNDSYVSQGCVWFNSASAPIGNVTIDKVEVRATTNNNSYTAFKATGANTLTDTIRIGNIYWQTFDLSGQTRFSGFNFHSIPGQVRLYVAGTNSIGLTSFGQGASLPIKLKATGEWVNVQLTTGITTAIGPLSASTTYNLYAYNSAATNAPYVIALEASATAPTVDTTGSYNVKTGDTTRTYVGTITTDGSGNFTTSSTVVSWYGTVYVLPTRNLTAAGLVTGGGNLSADRTFTVTAAVKADMTTPSSSTVAVTPSQVQNHPGVAKFWARLDGKTGSTCTIAASYNLTSCVRNGAGDYTLTFTTAFANANWAFFGTGYNSGTALAIVAITTTGNYTTTTGRFLCMTTGAASQDCDIINVAGYGSQ